jgi:hypothetical protein
MSVRTATLLTYCDPSEPIRPYLPMDFEEHIFFTPLTSHVDFVREWDEAGLRDVPLHFDLDRDIGIVPVSHAYRLPKHILAVAPPSLEDIGENRVNLRCWVDPYPGALYASPRAVLQLQHLARSGWLAHVDLTRGYHPEYLDRLVVALAEHDSALAQRLVDQPLPGYPPGLEPSSPEPHTPHARTVVYHPSTEIRIEYPCADPDHTESESHPPSCGCLDCQVWEHESVDSEDARWHDLQDAQENARIAQLRVDHPEDTDSEHWIRAGYEHNDSGERVAPATPALTDTYSVPEKPRTETQHT